MLLAALLVHLALLFLLAAQRRRRLVELAEPGRVLSAPLQPGDLLELVLKIASWVASAMARRVELWDDNLVIPPALAARAAVLAFGDELLNLELRDNSDSRWLSQGGREMATVHLLPRAGAALRLELQRLADAAKRAREGRSSSSSSSRAL